MHVMNLIWFGCIARLSQGEEGSNFRVQITRYFYLSSLRVEEGRAASCGPHTVIYEVPVPFYTQKQGCGSVFIWYGSGSRGFNDQKLGKFFLLLLRVIFALLDPDPDFQYGFGFTDPIESGSYPDPDPQPWLRVRIGTEQNLSSLWWVGKFVR